MECDRFEVLHRVVSIAQCTAFDYPRSVKGILRFLCHTFRLEEARFFLLDPKSEAFSQVIRASGPDFFQPFYYRLQGTAEGTVLRSRLPDLTAERCLFPVADTRSAFGILSLHPPSDVLFPAQFNDLVDAVGHELARLTRSRFLSHEEKQLQLRMELLIQLGEVLVNAQSLRDLHWSVVRTLLRCTHAAAVILRPIYGETLYGRSYIRTTTPFRHLRPLLIELEKENAAAAIASGQKMPLFQRIERRAPADAPLTMSTVPLFFQERILGTLTLFEGNREMCLPLSPDTDGPRLLTIVGSQVAHALERISSRERLENLSAESSRKLQETSLLYRISRAMHSTLRLNELLHLILSAAVVSDGGGFERAMLFTANERSGILQGMLGVDRHTATLILPPERGLLAWERPAIGEDVQEAQKQAEFCRQVMKQRLSLDANDNALARAVFKERIVVVTHPQDEPSAGADLAAALQLAPYACAPLMGRSRTLGVLVVDNPESLEEITPDRLRFLEMFASQAGAAMENSMLLHRLETAHQDLRETQERLIQGEKLAVLGEMSASVAHELKNPLVSIGGFAQRLSRITSPGNLTHEYSTIIAREVRRMEEMLSNILAFSKKQMLCFTACNIVDIVEEALMLEMDALDHASINTVKEFSPDLPLVHCDEQKLRQVIINLIANARQAMMDYGTLFIRVHRSLLRGDQAVAIEIEDTGGGISPEIMHNIFNPFFSTKDKGTGLGLSISHRIVEHHNGEIEVQNSAKGVVFIIRLPTHHTPAHLSIDKYRGFG